MSFLVAVGIAVVLTPVARAVGLAAGLTDRATDDPLKIHRAPVSVLGGAAVVGATFAAVAVVGSGFPWRVVLGVLVVLVMGIVDDVRPIPIVPRLVVQAAAAGVAIAPAVEANDLGALGVVGGILLVMSCANATNMLDGQDGLAGGLGAAAALGMAVLGVVESSPLAPAEAFALAGALIGFLVWNLRPPGIFLGNGGAYAVGTLLGLFALEVVAGDGWRGLLAAGACLGPFAFELVLTVFRRLRARGRVTAGDRLHSYDLAAERLGSRMRSTVAFWIAGLAAAGVGVLIQLSPLAVGIPLAAAAAGLGAAGAARLMGKRHVRHSP